MELTIEQKIGAIQNRIGTLTKDKTNPYFKSKYLDINSLLETIQPELHKEGLILLQPLTNVNGAPALETIITDGNEEIKYTAILPVNDDPQKMGSIITYFRRYAIVSLLALQAEDDDANSATKPVEELKARRTL